MRIEFGQPLFIAGLGIFFVLIAMGVSSILMQPTTQEVVTALRAPEPTGVVNKPASPLTQILPTFDVVRVTPEGETVIVGRTDPGMKVSILDGDRILGTVTADKRGQWVFVPEKVLPPGAHQLRLKVNRRGEPALFSDDDVVVFVPDPETSIAGDGVDKKGRALALRLSRSGEGSAALLQSPNAGHNAHSVRIDALDYNALGRVRVFGRATPGARVKVWLDGVVLGEIVADGKGTWQLNVDQIIKPGDYTLRAESTDAAGATIAQTDVPLTAAPADPNEQEPRVLIVEPGQNLWRIARYVYGSGPAYTYIYGANRDKIRDPNLIYPGQEFQLPDVRDRTTDARTP